MPIVASDVKNKSCMPLIIFNRSNGYMLYIMQRLYSNEDYNRFGAIWWCKFCNL